MPNFSPFSLFHVQTFSRSIQACLRFQVKVKSINFKTNHEEKVPLIDIIQVVDKKNVFFL